MAYLQYKKVGYHKGLRGDPPRIQQRGKSKCPPITEARAEALLNQGYREEPGPDGFPKRVFVEFDGRWYKAHGGMEGIEGPFYHAFPVVSHEVPSAALRRSRGAKP